MKEETGTYLYALVRSRRRPTATRMPAGLPGAGKPRLLDAGKGLWLVVSSAPLDRYGEAPIARGLRDLDWVSRCALAHEKVIARFLGAAALGPMRLFTIFRGDERALAHVAGRRAAIDKSLDRVAGAVEWGVRVSLDERAALRLAEERARSAGGSAATGTGFLMRKREVRDASLRLATETRHDMDRLFERLAGRARDAVRRPLVAGPAGSRVVLDVALLVPARDLATRRLRREVGAAAGELEDGGYHLSLTGPWPPYNFTGGSA